MCLAFGISTGQANLATAAQSPIVQELFSNLLAIEVDNKCILLNSAARAAASIHSQEIMKGYTADGLTKIEAQRQSFENAVKTFDCKTLATDTNVQTAKARADFSAGSQLIIWEFLLYSGDLNNDDYTCRREFISEALEPNKHLIDIVKDDPNYPQRQKAYKDAARQLGRACENFQMFEALYNLAISEILDAVFYQISMQKDSKLGALKMADGTDALRGEYHTNLPITDIPWAVNKYRIDYITKIGDEARDSSIGGFGISYGFTRETQFVVSIVGSDIPTLGTSLNNYKSVILQDESTGKLWEMNKKTTKFMLKAQFAISPNIQFSLPLETSEQIIKAITEGHKIRIFTRRKIGKLERTFDENMPPIYMDENFKQAIRYAFAPAMGF